MITERDAEMDMGDGPVSSTAFSVYENGELLGVEVSPVNEGLTLEETAVRLADILNCERVEEVAALEEGPPGTR